MTPWIAQGSTSLCPIVIDFGVREKTHGVSYVSMSRATDLNNICIGAGCSVERLTTKISSMKKVQNRLLEDIRLESLYRRTTDLMSSIN